MNVKHHLQFKENAKKKSQNIILFKFTQERRKMKVKTNVMI